MSDTLQQWAQEGKLSQGKLSSDGKLSLDDVSVDASDEIEVSFDGKSCRYTLASMFLQVLDPNQSLMAYRNACKAHSVTDPVKALDKRTVVAFFLGADSVAAPAAAPAAAPEKASTSSSRKEKKHRKDKKRESSSRKRHRESSSEKRHRESLSPERKKKKQPKAPMTTEQLFSNLNVVVDKRATTESSQEEIHKALSAEGFDVTPELLEQHRPALDLILPLEIPVGNSASILRPATAVDRNFTRVLELYNETIKPPSSSSKKSPSLKSSSSKSQKQDRSYLVGKKPVIVLPKGMSAPITMANGYEFFANSKYVPRDASRKVQKPPTTFTRKVAARLGGGVMEYELMDNPTTKLGKDASEWQRVVAVIALGASWQFADWPGAYKEPVHLFGRTYGFYIGMEGDKIPPELEGWAVRKGKLNRDKRGLDSVCYAGFWNGLDEWMSIHKPEMLPQTGR